MVEPILKNDISLNHILDEVASSQTLSHHGFYVSPLMGPYTPHNSPSLSSGSTGVQLVPVYFVLSPDVRHSGTLGQPQRSLLADRTTEHTSRSTLWGDPLSPRRSQSSGTTTRSYNGTIRPSSSHLSSTTPLSSLHPSQITLTFTLSNLLKESKKISANEETLLVDLNNQVRILPSRFEENYFFGKITPNHLRTKEEYAVILKGKRFLLHENLKLGDIGIKNNDSLCILRVYNDYQKLYILDKNIATNNRSLWFHPVLLYISLCLYMMLQWNGYQ